MTCDQAIELLPWLLNRTLEDQEREEVRQHLRTCERCREALPETQAAWRLFDEHLPTEALVALSYGEVPEGIDPSAAEQHLASCPQCAAELELARMSRRLEDEDNVAVFPGAKARQVRDGESRKWRSAALAAGLAGVVALSGWINSARQLDLTSDRLAEAARETDGRAAAPAPATPPAAAPVDDPALREQLAAAQAQREQLEALRKKSEEAVTQAQEQIAQFQQERERLLRPQANTWTGDLGNPDVVRGDDSSRTLPADRFAQMILPPGKSEGLPAEREAEILDAAGKPVWQAPRLLLDRYGYFNVTLPPGSLSPGRYTVQLFTREGGKRVPRERWEIEVVKSLPAAS
ncbi:MAG TPA: zf-HC2 domain-containing protein [Thermoanaerobaculia bacterium]|nr:zf-HC2 domain-containing protein [Thermoanaerobaculia bacterium]